jgi:hypothetical protein
VIKVFLSTKSGAEGVNLMNVRQVHIMEPYWNDLRIKQAIGRAVRQCSHATLPRHLRTVDAYIYRSTIDSFPLGEDIDERGRNHTTDEYVLQVARKKQGLIDRAQLVMKEIAVDCKLSEKHNKIGDDFVCYEPLADNELRLDLNQEPSDREIFSTRELKKQRFITFRSPADGQLYRIREEDNPSARANPRNTPFSIDVYHQINNIVVGRIESTANGQVKLVKLASNR